MKRSGWLRALGLGTLLVYPAFAAALEEPARGTGPAQCLEIVLRVPLQEHHALRCEILVLEDPAPMHSGAAIARGMDEGPRPSRVGAMPWALAHRTLHLARTLARTCVELLVELAERAVGLGIRGPQPH